MTWVWRIRRGAAVVAVSFAALVAVTTATADASATKIGWSKCFGGPFQCGTLQVPLDYSKPNGATISLAVVRLPATDPGAPDRVAVPQPRRARRLGRRLHGLRRSRPLHPRGAGALRPRRLRPAGHRAQHRAALLRQRRGSGSRRSEPFAFPLTPEELDAWIAADRYLVDACDQRGGRIIDHMATADVARDMDRLRAAVGDDAAHLRGRLLRLLPRRHLREPVPRPGQGRRGRRRARPDRLVDRPRQRGGDAAVLDPAAERRRRAGHAERVLPPLRRRRPELRVLGRRGRPLCGAREPPAREPRPDHVP